MTQMSTWFTESGLGASPRQVAHYCCLRDDCRVWRVGGVTTLAQHLAAVHGVMVTTPTFARVDASGRLLTDTGRVRQSAPPTDVDGWIRTQRVVGVSRG